MKYKNTLLLAALLAAHIPCYALDITGEASIGHSANCVGAAYSIGAVTSLTDTISLHAGYASLGIQRLNLLANEESAADDIGAGKGTAPYYWIPPKRIHTLYIQSEYRIGNYFLGAGFAAYHPMQQEDRHIGDNTLPYVGNTHRTNITPVFSIGYYLNDKTQVVLTHNTITEFGDWESHTPSSSIFTTSIRRSF